MARYIDACSLRDKVSESLKNNSHKVDIVARNHNIEHAHFLMLIADEPTADVQEIKHGYWMLNKCPDADEKLYFCPFCAMGESDSGKDNFCPYCGRRMDMDKE